MRARRRNAQTHRVQLARQPVAQRSQLCDDPVHVRVDARSELDDRRVRFRECVKRELVREPREHIVACLGQRPTGRLEQHELLLDPDRIPLIKLVVPACPQGEATRPIAEPAAWVAIRALVCLSRYPHRAPSRPFRGSVVVTHCPTSARSTIRSTSAAALSSSARAATKTLYRMARSRLSAASQAFHARVTRCADRRQS